VDRIAFAFHCSTPLFSLAGDFHITATLALVKNLWWWFLNERMCDLEVQQSSFVPFLACFASITHPNYHHPWQTSTFGLIPSCFLH
jgi:hypothetical protein